MMLSWRRYCVDCGRYTECGPRSARLQASCMFLDPPACTKWAEWVSCSCTKMLWTRTGL